MLKGWTETTILAFAGVASAPLPEKAVVLFQERHNAKVEPRPGELVAFSHVVALGAFVIHGLVNAPLTHPAASAGYRNPEQ